MEICKGTGTPVTVSGRVLSPGMMGKLHHKCSADIREST